MAVKIKLQRLGKIRTALPRRRRRPYPLPAP